ncbi:MAG: T9SS type A sorting domain-containing protein [Bacteroidia bacterium]
MKKILALGFLLGYIGLDAQITINQNDMPDVGDTIRLSYAASTNNVDHTLTGANYLWDFSALVPNAQERIEFTAPTALPFNFLADLGTLNPSPDSIPFIGDVPTNFIDYFKNGSSGYRQIGSSFDYAPIGSFSIPVIFSSSDYVYRFPTQYGNVDSSNSAYGIPLPSIGYIGQNRKRVNEVDGWGTLITPYGTFQTLRIKSIVDATDTISLDSTTGFTIPRPREIQYKWLANGMDIPVLEVDVQILFNAEVISSIAYQDSIRDSVFQVGVSEQVKNISSVGIFPNPATNQATLSYDLANPFPVIVRVLDVTGKSIQTNDLGQKNIGKHQFTFDLSILPAGIYFIQIDTGTEMYSQRLVVIPN